MSKKPNYMEQIGNNMLNNNTTTQTNQKEGFFQTQSQRDLIRAVNLMNSYKERANKDQIKGFITRVKQFPTLVMQIGLAQAISFSLEKTNSSDTKIKAAHKQLLFQVAHILLDKDFKSDTQEDYQEEIVDKINNASAEEYMHLTRRLLSAWSFHRRFAVSILQENQEENENERR